MLAEDIADIGHEARQRQGILVTVADVDGANHHECPCHILCRTVPPLLVERLARRDIDHDFYRVLIEHFYLVVVDDLVLHLVRMAVGGASGDVDALRLLAVAEDNGGVGLQLQLFHGRALVLGQFQLFLRGLLGVLDILGVFLALSGVGWLLLEVVVGLLQEGYVVIECLEVPRRVDGEVTVVGDGVTERRAVL